MDTRTPADLLPEALQTPIEPVSLIFRLFLTLVAVSNTITLLPVLQLLLPAQVALLDPQHKVVSLDLIRSVRTTGRVSILIFGLPNRRMRQPI